MVCPLVSILRRPPAEEGDDVFNIETPALVVDLDAMDHNLQRMKQLMTEFPRVNIRAHAKAQRCPEIAHLQGPFGIRHMRGMNALLGSYLTMCRGQVSIPGAEGVCCQKVSEAEAMAEGGIKDILVSNEVISRGKLRRLAELARSVIITAIVDCPLGATTLSVEAAAAGSGVEVWTAGGTGSQIGVLVDVNVGQNRCGVEGAAAAVVLGCQVADLPNLQLRGIQAYHGGIQHVRDFAERRAEAAKAAGKAQEVVQALHNAGLACPVVSGGGTGTFMFDATSGVYTEVQPGSYIFGDADYNRKESGAGQQNEWEHSLFVYATVISRCDAYAVLDAGLKAMIFDSGPPLVAGCEGNMLECSIGGDEHCVLKRKDGGLLKENEFEVGRVVRLIPGHCDPTVNMHDFMVGLQGQHVESLWKIAGRGPGF